MFGLGWCRLDLTSSAAFLFLKLAIWNPISRRQFPPSSPPSAGTGGASEAGAAGGGARPQGGPQEDAGHPAAAVGPGAADAALRAGGRGESQAG